MQAKESISQSLRSFIAELVDCPNDVGKSGLKLLPLWMILAKDDDDRKDKR